MIPTTCPGYAELKGLCRNPLLPHVGLCTRCAQLEIARRKQEPRGCEVRWGFGSEGEMM